MSLAQSASDSVTPEPPIGQARASYDGSVSLNDDLAASEYSSESFPSQVVPGGQRGSGALSYRNSMDAESVFLSSAYFNILNRNQEDSINGSSQEIFSPLGPNSIYELTIASDTARSKRNRPPKSSITINGGTVVANLIAPSTKDIPQIQLLKLNNKVSNKELHEKHVSEVVPEYKNFELSYNSLTEDTLNKFIEQNRRGSVVNANEDESMTAVPPVFSSDDFRLDDPRIFKQVIENASILPKESDEPQSHLVNNTDIQDKLSHYLDVVEINLIKEISRSSESFFSTIGDIEKIQSQAKDCVVKFDDIQKKLENMERDHSQRGYDILHKLIRKKNAEALESSLLQLQYIVSTFELASKSFNNAKYSKCLNEIVIVEALINGVSFEEFPDNEIKPLYPKFPYPPTDVSRLPALVHLRNDLQSLKDECSKGYINDFIDLLISDLRSHYANVSTQDTLNRMYVGMNGGKKHLLKKINNSYTTISSDKKEKLTGFINDLVKADCLTQAYTTYQDKIIAEIKDIIKQNLPSSSHNGQSLLDTSTAPSRSSSVPPDSGSSALTNPGGTLSSNIKNLTPKDFEEMLTSTYTNLSECLRRLTAHQKILLDLALTATPPTSMIDVMSLDITVSINKAIELTQIRITKVINVRLEQTADLSVPFYLRLYAITSAYLQECELINPGYAATGAGSSLSEWFRHHIKYFIHRFQLNSLKILSADCDREVWKEVTLPATIAEYQTIVDEITGYAEFVESRGASGFSGEKWLSVLNFYEVDELPENPEATAELSESRLKVSQESFFVPYLILKSLKQVKDYATLSKVFPNAAANIGTNLLNYFKLMNSKTSQAVLNAGATRTAGLKHITTKHLALCIQLVEFNITFLGKIKPIFPPEESNPNQQHEVTFDRIISNYKDHENELFSKLVSIMHDRTVTHCAAASKIEWSAPLQHTNPKEPKQCHQYMETLVKDTLTVSKVLFKYLPELKCSLILLQIFDNCKKLFVECYCTQLPQFKDFNEKHSVLRDIDYFRVKLCELPGYGNSGQVIWENVNSMPTVEDTRMEEVMRHNIEGERKKSMEVVAEKRAENKDQPAEPEIIPEEPPKDEGNKDSIQAKEAALKDDTPNEEAPNKEAPSEEAPSEEAPSEEAPSEEAPSEEAPNKEAPIEKIPHEETPKDDKPKDDTPKDNATKVDIPRDDITKDETPKDETPKDETPKDETPVEVASNDMIVKDEPPKEDASKPETPKDEAPRNNQNENTQKENTGKNDILKEQVLENPAKPDETTKEKKDLLVNEPVDSVTQIDEAVPEEEAEDKEDGELEELDVLKDEQDLTAISATVDQAASELDDSTTNDAKEEAEDVLQGARDSLELDA